MPSGASRAGEWGVGGGSLPKWCALHRQCSLVVNVGTVGLCAWSVQIWKISKDEQQQQQPGVQYAISRVGQLFNLVMWVSKRTGRWCLEEGSVCCIKGAGRQLAMCVWCV